MEGGDLAFPFEEKDNGEVMAVHEGLSKRDYIAIQAMNGLTSRCEPRDLINSSSSSLFKAEIAKACYEIADAMIEQSQQDQA